MFRHERLHCYRVALEVAKRVPAIVRRWPRGHSSLEDQLKRSAMSVVLNIAEGNSRTGPKDRARFFAIARGSAAESASAIDVAVAYRLMEASEGEEMKDWLLQIVKMLSRLR